jgi:PPM family protein phosphatase
MQCSNCGAKVLESDCFCEECGTGLKAVITVGCEKCGAALAQIDAEGFCTNCGFRRGISDRWEVIHSAQLVGISDRGLQHHRNEDCFALDTVQQTAILVVCDGVSSSHDSNLAAQVAATTVCQQLVLAVPHQPPHLALTAAIATAQAAVSQLAAPLPTDRDPPSTTLVAAVVQDQTATIAWLGDSRAYWLTPTTQVQQLTHDDSWFNQAVETGEMSVTEASRSPNAHAITRWLGADAGADCQPTIVTFTLPSAGYLLLCTDGLWNYAATPQKMTELIQPQLSCDVITIAKFLVDYAIQRGGHDNITVALLST